MSQVNEDAPEAQTDAPQDSILPAGTAANNQGGLLDQIKPNGLKGETKLSTKQLGNHGTEKETDRQERNDEDPELAKDVIESAAQDSDEDEDAAEEQDMLDDVEDALEEEGEEQLFEEEEEELASDLQGDDVNAKPISDKVFYKEMAKIKEKSRTTGSGTLPPKKSASAYIIFQKEKRPEILAKNPKAKVTEVVKEIARCWSLMSKEDRHVYKVEAKRDKERYERELRQLETQSKSIKKPKKCLSAYMIFVKETRPRIVAANPNLNALYVMKAVGKAWQSSTEADRKYYKDMANLDKTRYLSESRKFYEEVARVGNINKAESGKGGQARGQGKAADKSEGLQKKGDDETLAGKKRVANQTTRKILQRQSSMPSNPSKRVADQVMAMGLAPEGGGRIDSPRNMHTQKRVRAESKFTFKPDELSDDHQLSRQEDFENDEDDSDGLLGETNPPDTALHFFAREFRVCLEQDFVELKNQVLKQAIKKRWNELTLKQKAPFEQLAQQKAQKDEEEQKKAGSIGARRGNKAAQKKQVQSAIASTQQLSRTQQRIAKEALTIPKAMQSDLQASLDQQQKEQGEEGLEGNQNQPFEDGNNAKQLELEIPGAGNEIDNFGLTRNTWPNINRYPGQNLSHQSGNNLQNQNYAAQQAAMALALQGHLLNPQLNSLSGSLMTNHNQTTHGSSNQHFGHQGSGDDLGVFTPQNNNFFSNDQLQHQLLQQMTGSNQQNLNQQMLLLQMAQQGLLNPLLNPQAAFHQLQQQSQALLNQNLINQYKQAGNFSYGNNQGHLSALDLFGGQGNLMHGLQKTMETPQFAGMSSENLLGDNDMNVFSTLPTAATQPIQNIFYPTSAIEENISIQNLLGTHSGMHGNQTTQGNHDGQNGSHNSFFFQNFQLPASAQPSAFTMGADHGTASAQQMFGQDNKNALQHHTQNHHHNVSPQFSPQISAMNNNDHLNHDPSQQLLMWQQNMPHSKKNGSSNSMLMSGFPLQSNSNKNNFATTQQMTPTSMTFMNSYKEQQQSNTNGNSQSNPYMLGQGNNTPQHTAGGGLSNINEPNSTSVTPFLKPTMRQHDMPSSNQFLFSPFHSAMHPSNGGLATNFNLTSMMGGPQSQAQISPLNNSQAYPQQQGLIGQMAQQQNQLQQTYNQQQAQSVGGQGGSFTPQSITGLNTATPNGTSFN